MVVVGGVRETTDTCQMIQPSYLDRELFPQQGAC